MSPIRGGFLLCTGCVAMLVFAAKVFAMDCPAPPVQANKDWDTQVRAEVGKIGLVTGAQLQTRVRSATQDLMGRLPVADRLYIEQMMFAAYCSALHGDKTLPESVKARQILEYRRELQKSLSPVALPTQTAPQPRR